MSRKFAMIKPVFWNGDTARTFRGNHAVQALIFYVMTCRDSLMTGLYHLSFSSICRELGMTAQVASDSLQLLEEHGFIKYDREEEVIWVINMAEHQIGEKLAKNDTRRPMILKYLQDLKHHQYMQEFIDKYRDSIGIGSGPDGSLIPYPLSILSSETIESKPRAKKSKDAVAIPADWSVTGKLMEWCQEKRISERDIKAQAEMFTADAEKNGKEFKDWNAAFRTWMLKAIQWQHVTLVPEKLSPPSKASPPKDQTISSGITHPNALDDVLSGALFAHVKH